MAGVGPQEVRWKYELVPEVPWKTALSRRSRDRGYCEGTGTKAWIRRGKNLFGPNAALSQVPGRSSCALQPWKIPGLPQENESGPQGRQEKARRKATTGPDSALAGLGLRSSVAFPKSGGRETWGRGGRVLRLRSSQRLLSYLLGVRGARGLGACNPIPWPTPQQPPEN